MGVMPGQISDIDAWRGILKVRERFEKSPDTPCWALTHGGDGTVRVDVGGVADCETLVEVERDGGVRVAQDVSPDIADMFRLYLPLCAAPKGLAVGHLGQSLDGKIATVSGASHYVTGSLDILHNHRMRALFDVVVVGSGTVLHDDPQLTVRHCWGRNPVRVVIDMERRLKDHYRIFQDNAAATILICAVDKLNGSVSHGSAELLGLPRCDVMGLEPRGLCSVLAARGYQRVFVEGGGITVSRFLEAKCLDRLQVTVSPMIIGSGRSAITLPEVASLSEGLRPVTRRFSFGEDVMFECLFDG